jgi:DNA ligase-1
MKTLNKIYKRTSTGKIQEWYIEVEGNKYRTISGQTDGKKVISAWTTCKGKNIGKTNETTPEEQALAEALAKRTKKLEGEYKENIKTIDDVSFLSPMLAEDYADVTLSYEKPLFVQPKLDGIRCIATIDKLVSRNNKEFVSCPHIREALKEVFKDDSLLELDGELYNHELKDDFDTLVSHIRRTKPSPQEIKECAETIKYYVYDIRDKTKPFSERFKKLEKIVKRLKNPLIVLVDTREVEDQDTLDKYYTEFLDAGFEGQMIRSDTVYEFDRTKALVKRKEFITDEFEVVDVLEGKGNRAGMAGKIVVKLHKTTTDGKDTCEANPKGNFDFYKRLLTDKEKVIGKKATIEFQNYTPKGSLRFPKMLTIRDYE